MSNNTRCLSLEQISKFLESLNEIQKYRRWKTFQKQVETFQPTILQICFPKIQTEVWVGDAYCPYVSCVNHITVDVENQQV